MQDDDTQSGVSRFSVSLPAGLLDHLDEMVREKGYDNRSLAIADMIRDELVEHRQQYGTGEMAGTITLVYDHHRSDIQAVLTDLQHDHLHEVIVTTHVHLDHNNCLEVIVVRGTAQRLRRLANQLIATRGIKHGKLTLTSTGADLVA